jgi:bisphosphoglycerate-independent phosphoglycerate mutase (AlkP superfamily)
MGAGVFTRNATDLIARDAVASEIVNDGWRDRLGIKGLPEIDAHTAGAILARISADFDLTLFAHYRTDDAGHAKDMGEATSALERVDAFLAGVVEGLARDCMLVIASDHGNIEDIRTGHTRNPAMGLVAGSGHDAASRDVMSLLDVVPMIRRILTM